VRAVDGVDFDIAAGETLDRSAAIIHSADFDDLFVTPGRIHEVALNSRGRLPSSTSAAWPSMRARRRTSGPRWSSTASKC
jgi:hypothetical protein